MKSTTKYWKPVQKAQELLKRIPSMQPFLQSKALQTSVPLTSNWFKMLPNEI